MTENKQLKQAQNKKSTESLFTPQEQGKATDYESVACINSDDSQQHRARVIAAVLAFTEGHRAGVRGRTQGRGRQGKRGTHRRTRSLCSEPARRSSSGTHRRSGSLQVAQAGSQSGMKQGAGPLTNTKPPKPSSAVHIINTDTCKSPVGVKP